MKTVRIKNSVAEISVNNIFCVGQNYLDHAKEMGGTVPEVPMIFSKPASTLIYNNDTITYPEHSNEMHHEVELVLLIGEKIKNVSIEEAEEAIIGYAVGLDMTLRDLQRKYKDAGHPWTLAKGFDNSAVVSDFVPKTEYTITGDEEISMLKNGNVQQKSTLSKMIFKPVDIVKFLSDRITLHPGDLIYTGTPEGVSKVERGDVLISKIQNIGEICNKIV